MIKKILVTFVVMILVPTLFFAEKPVSATDRVKISGKVTNVKHDTAKAAVGKITFNGKNSRGENYTGKGTVKITFGKTKKVINKMEITFRGKKGSKNVRGTLFCYQKITFANAVGSKFEFSQVMGSAEGNNI